MNEKQAKDTQLLLLKTHNKACMFVERENLESSRKFDLSQIN